MTGLWKVLQHGCLRYAIDASGGARRRLPMRPRFKCRFRRCRELKRPLSPTGKLLTIEDAVRIGLENHPRIKSANERIGSQEAVLGQQMAAYYPTVSLSNQYQTVAKQHDGGADRAVESLFQPGKLQHDAL